MGHIAEYPVKDLRWKAVPAQRLLFSSDLGLLHGFGPLSDWGELSVLPWFVQETIQASPLPFPIPPPQPRYKPFVERASSFNCFGAHECDAINIWCE